MSLDLGCTVSPGPGILRWTLAPGWNGRGWRPAPTPAAGQSCPCGPQPRAPGKSGSLALPVPWLQSWVRSSPAPVAAVQRKSQEGEAGADPGDSACSLQCRFIGKNANDSLHFILPTDCAGSNNWLLPTPVIAAALLTLCKGLPHFRCIYSNQPAGSAARLLETRSFTAP